MPKFEKKYVHFMWDDKLKGKKVFYADDINTLIKDVTDGNNMGIVKEAEATFAPFEVKCDFWKFVYFDPYYELKVAHEEGKTIQYLVGEKWDDLHEPIWKYESECYRIKPDEPNRTVTNRELARWLAQGNGECTEKGIRDTSINCYANFDYPSLFQDDPIPDSFLIRKWEDEEWHEPTREYMGLD